MAKMTAGHKEPAAQDVSKLDAGELTEARRIAGELVRLDKDGVISEADALFYANLVHIFDAIYTKPVAAESDATPPIGRSPLTISRI